MSGIIRRMLGRFAALVLVSVFALAVMVASGTRWFRGKEPARNTVETGASAVARPRMPVAVRRLEPGVIETFSIFSGMIHPYERFTLAFEIAGRIGSLGHNGTGQDLDENDLVEAGQVLAVLDQRELAARAKESKARRELAEAELVRAETLRSRNTGAISDAELEKTAAQRDIAAAQWELAEKQLQDATLISPVRGVISRRFLKAGESVNPHQLVFEIVQVDRVRLVLGVPESKVRSLLLRQRELRQSESPSQAAASANPPRRVFSAHVDLIGRDLTGRPWPSISGEVVRISETADETSGQFLVEVVLPNEDGLLRPGLIGIARLVTGERTAMSIPITAAQFNQEAAHIFCVIARVPDYAMIPPYIGPLLDFEAVRHELPRGTYIEQGEELVLLELPPDRRAVVVRGHHRLADGAPVRLVAEAAEDVRPEEGVARGPAGVPR